MKASRRQILRASLAATALVASPRGLQPAEGEEKERAARNVSCLPVYNVRDFGAKPDGITLNTIPIQHAIDEASASGGGTVYIPPGNYLTGTISLRNHVTLHLEAGATIWGSKNRDDYSQGSLVHAENVTHATICGRGIIDGNGTSFWSRIDRPSGKGRWVANKWRPDALVIFARCTNLLLDGVTFRNSPAWHIHPIQCDLLVIRGISILAGIYENDGPNTDGIDPDGCSRVRISDCYIQTGDDAIVLKCTDILPESGTTRTCRDVAVTNCVLISSDAAIKIGTESYGEFRNINFSNCAIRDAACGIELTMRDGGLIDGLVIDNISMTLSDGGEPIVMTQYPRSGLHGSASSRKGVTLGTVRNVMISSVEVTGCGGVFLQGMAEKHLELITLVNVRLHVRAGRDKTKTENINPPYPFLSWSKYTPYGIYCRYIDGLKLQNVQLIWDKPEDADWGSAIRCRSVHELEIDGFSGRQSRGSGKPAIHLVDTKSAFIHNCWAVEETEEFLRIGEGSQDISLMSNDLHRTKRPFFLEPGVDEKELYAAGNRLPGS